MASGKHSGDARGTGRGLSIRARERLEHELGVLREQRERMAAQIRAKDPVGDQADEAYLLRVEDDIAAIDDRIMELTDLIASGGRGTRGVPDGTTVTLRFSEDDVQTLRVVTVPEEIPAGQEDTMVTSDSPLGLALAGRKAGDTITYSAPMGLVHAEILSLEPPE